MQPRGAAFCAATMEKKSMMFALGSVSASPHHLEAIDQSEFVWCACPPRHRPRPSEHFHPGMIPGTCPAVSMSTRQMLALREPQRRVLACAHKQGVTNGLGTRMITSPAPPCRNSTNYNARTTDEQIEPYLAGDNSSLISVKLRIFPRISLAHISLASLIFSHFLSQTSRRRSTSPSAATASSTTGCWTCAPTSR